MFLTKKSFIKILVVTACYFVLGSICVGSSLGFNFLGFSEKVLMILGIILILLCGPIALWGVYAEGKGKLLNLGNKLVRNELKPAEFIRQYALLKNSDSLIICKPSIEILQLLTVAYDVSGDRENAIKTTDEMIELASDKKKNFAKLVRSSLLFSYGKTEQAEALFNEVQAQKLDFVCLSLVDSILKDDRAMALGDYKTVELYCLKALERSFPKPDNLGTLVIRYRLGEVYEKLQQAEKSVAHYQYCAAYGGETAIKTSAVEKLK